MHEELYGGWSRNRFTGADIAEVKTLLADNPTERHNLEYKAADWRNNHELAAQITSLANSAGGILVWGVREKPAPPRVDPRHDAVDKQRLTDILSSSVSPPLDFQHFDVQSVPAPGGGAVYVLYVPQSARAPHMVTSKGDHFGKYHKRGIEGCVVMLDYEVRDAMGRRQRPDLRLQEASALCSPYHAGSRRPGIVLHVPADHHRLRLTIANHGRAVAHTVAVVVTNLMTTGVDVRRLTEDNWRQAHAPASLIRYLRHIEEPLFPGVPLGISFTWSLNMPDGSPRRQPVLFETTVYCDGAAPVPQRFSWHLDGSHLREVSGPEYDELDRHFEPERYMQRLRADGVLHD